MTVDELIDDLIEDGGMNCTPQQFRAKAALQKIAPYFEDSEYGDLWLAMLGLAVIDVCTYEPGTCNSYFTVDAYEYLSQDIIPACAVAGVDSDFVRRIIKTTVGVELGQ